MVTSTITGTRERGFSLIELLIVISISLILVAIAIPSIRGHRTLYRTEDQSLKIINLLRLAGQKAITERQRMRVEINLTDNLARVVDENGTGATTDDRTVSEVRLDDVSEVRMCLSATPNTSKPANVTPLPVATLHDPVVFTTVGGKLIWTAYFQNDGTITNAANSIMPSGTLMFWQPDGAANQNNARTANTVRAITISSGAGAVRYWKYNGTGYTRG